MRFNEQQREYDCPLQLKASGGVLLIDDLGAQSCPAGDLLARCLEPLVTGVDSLTTLTGRRIPVPFTTVLVLATSAHPAALLAEEHLRRLPCKIEVPDPTPEAFRELVRRACVEAGMACDAAGMDYLIERCYTRPGRPLRAAHPAEFGAADGRRGALLPDHAPVGPALGRRRRRSLLPEHGRRAHHRRRRVSGGATAPRPKCQSRIHLSRWHGRGGQ